MNGKLIILHILRVILCIIAAVIVGFCLITPWHVYVEEPPRYDFNPVTLFHTAALCMPLLFLVGTGIYTVSCKIGMYELSAPLSRKRVRRNKNTFGKKLLLSSIFPALNFAVYESAASFHTSGKQDMLFNIVCALSGGVLPILIMLITKTDTADKLKYRLAAVVIFLIVGLFAGTATVGIVLILMVIAADVLMFIKRKSITEWIIVTLSDPGIYLLLTLLNTWRGFKI